MMRLFYTVCSVVLLFGFSGCGDSDVHNNPLMRKVEQYREEGRPELAEKFCRELLRQRPDSPAAHLAMATLCDESLDRPAAALFHYDEFLRLAPPDDPEREPVAGYRKLVRARLLRQLKAEDLPQLPPGEVDALRAEVARLRTVNLRLAERITAVQREQAQRARRETPGRGGSAGEDSPGGRRYRVQSGDTLGRIAVKFYGSAAKSEGIRRANRLPEGAVLRIGQELILPAE